ncbi:MAG: MBL fold metallo-hydrolase, partial [Xanthomonadales bacterium]|nr:MBL fold metallo-hydrolase [Xanthomonadales bacterium]
TAIENIVETGATSDGTPLAPEVVSYFEQTLDYFEIIDAELRRVKIPSVTREMTDSLSIDLGGREVQLRHFGYGNTKGDVVMYLPGEKILATGDVMVFPTPYGFGSYPRSWAGVLRKLKSLEATTIVPGHGDIQSDFAYGDLLIETLELVANQVDVLAAEGKTLEEVRESMDFSSVEHRFTHGDELLKSRFRVWFKTPIVEAAYRLASGKDNEPLEASAEE